MAKFDQNLVDLTNIQANFCKCLNDRYSLILPKKNATTGTTAVVILKNPASTLKSAMVYNNIAYGDAADVDKTTSHMIDFFFGSTNRRQSLGNLQYTKYSKLITLNLFPYYDNIPAALNPIYDGMKRSMPNQSMRDNLDEIDRILKNNASNMHLFLAWGGYKSGVNKQIYDNTIIEVENIIIGNLIYNIYYMDGNKTLYKVGAGNPPHNLKPNGFPQGYPLHGLLW